MSDEPVTVALVAPPNGTSSGDLNGQEGWSSIGATSLKLGTDGPDTIVTYPNTLGVYASQHPITTASHFKLTAKIKRLSHAGGTHDSDLVFNFGSADDAKWVIDLNYYNAAGATVNVTSPSGGGGGSFAITVNTWTDIEIDIAGDTCTFRVNGTIYAMTIDSSGLDPATLNQLWINLTHNIGTSPIWEVRAVTHTTYP